MLGRIHLTQQKRHLYLDLSLVSVAEWCESEIDKTEDYNNMLENEISDLETAIDDAKEQITTLIAEIEALDDGIRGLDKEVADPGTDSSTPLEWSTFPGVLLREFGFFTLTIVRRSTHSTPRVLQATAQQSTSLSLP